MHKITKDLLLIIRPGKEKTTYDKMIFLSAHDRIMTVNVFVQRSVSITFFISDFGVFNQHELGEKFVSKLLVFQHANLLGNTVNYSNLC